MDMKVVTLPLGSSLATPALGTARVGAEPWSAGDASRARCFTS